MNYKLQFVDLVERIAKIRVFKTASMPNGIDVFHDLSRFLPNVSVKTVFDVGANVGQSYSNFARRFPGARVYCFEPVAGTFRQLERNLRHAERVEVFRIALGARKGSGSMLLEGQSPMYFLQREIDNAVAADAITEEVEIDTIDDFCREHRVSTINYLKVDTEGSDLDVLVGSEVLLCGQKIDIIEVEAGMSPTNRRHVPFDKINSFLEAKRYSLFGVYEQVREWPTGKPNLRRVNAVYISDNVGATLGTGSSRVVASASSLRRRGAQGSTNTETSMGSRYH